MAKTNAFFISCLLILIAEPQANGIAVGGRSCIGSLACQRSPMQRFDQLDVGEKALRPVMTPSRIELSNFCFSQIVFEEKIVRKENTLFVVVGGFAQPNAKRVSGGKLRCHLDGIE